MDFMKIEIKIKGDLSITSNSEHVSRMVVDSSKKNGM